MADHPERGISEEKLFGELEAAIARESERVESDDLYSDVPDYLEQAITDRTLSENKAKIIAENTAEAYMRQFQAARERERMSFLLYLHEKYLPKRLVFLFHKKPL